MLEGMFSVVLWPERAISDYLFLPLTCVSPHVADTIGKYFKFESFSVLLART